MDPQKTTAQPKREPKLLPFGRKAHEFAFRHPAQDKRLTILEGSVRSSKTWSVMVKILILCKYQVAGQRLITGVSKATVKANILDDLFEIIGSKNYDYNQSSGELRLFDTHWRVIGAKDEGSEKYLRGITVGVVVSDEITLMPKSFVFMLLSRLSPPGARWYSTTNPDNPYHYVKTDLIDNKDLANDIEVIHLTLDDNPNLTEDYKAFIRRSYTGVWYSRYVSGLWVMAEGAIYGDVISDDLYYDDTSRTVGLLSRGGHVERWLTVDVGTINAFAVGDFYDDGRVLWLERELYWDSKVQHRQKSNSEYASDLVAFVGDLPQREWPGVIIDPSAASFKVDLVSRGFYVVDAKNEVLEGIRRVSTMMTQRKIRIHQRCVNTKRELSTYSWDDKRSEKGTEQPIKHADHMMDVIRYMISTRVNDWRLAS